jgi:pSer/pThr/pTyr-binding forkhead associated (FHA) protein
VAAVVRVNGVLLGAEPTPLIHGDKIEFGTVGDGSPELFFGDDRKGGSTQFIAAMNLPDIQKLRSPAPGKATSATGGRVISLVDGREYTIPSTGVTFGRDASCDVVIPSSEVSRRHAEIVPGDIGYVLSDTSTNGIFVNGERIEAMQLLGRGDVVRIGTEEFRFYADALPVPQAAPAPAPAPAARAPEPVSGPAGRSAGSASTRAPLAKLEVNGDGPLKGQVFGVTSVLAHLGRGGHNDIVIPEESVSDSHAKLQRRDGLWYVTDLGSTNGTYVGGKRIQIEERLRADTELRVGGISLTFKPSISEPTTEPRGATKQFSVADAQAGLAPAPVVPAPVGSSVATPKPPSRPRPVVRRESSSAPPPPPPPEARVPWWGWIIAFAAIAGTAVYLYLAKSR